MKYLQEHPQYHVIHTKVKTGGYWCKHCGLISDNVVRYSLCLLSRLLIKIIAFLEQQILILLLIQLVSMLF